MGIKESLKNQPEHENLRNFTMPEKEPKQELEFDPEKEIEPELQKKIFARITHDSIAARYKVLADFKLIFPTQYYIAPDRFWIKIKEKIIEQEKTNLPSLENISYYAAISKRLFPQRFRDLNLQYNFADFYNALNNIGVKGSENMIKTIFMAIDLKIICPEHQEKIQIDQAKRYLLRQIQDNLWSQENNPEKSELYYQEYKNLASDLAELRLLFPADFDQLADKEQIIKKSIKDFRKRMRKLKKSSFLQRDTDFQEGIISMAVDLKIITASEVKFTDQGLELIMPQKSIHQSTPERPKRREY